MLFENKFEPILALDLQYFAEGDETPPPGEGEQQQEQQQQEQKEEKTFTQKDVNNLIKKETAQATEKLLKSLGFEGFENAKDGITKFKEWQDSQKTDAEKQAAALEQASKDLEATKAEKETLAAQLTAFKLGAKAETLEDFILLARAKVTEEVTMEEAMKLTLETYPQFKAQQEQQQNKPSFSGGQHVPPAGNGTDDPFAAKLAKYK